MGKSGHYGRSQRPCATQLNESAKRLSCRNRTRAVLTQRAGARHALRRGHDPGFSPRPGLRQSSKVWQRGRPLYQRTGSGRRECRIRMSMQYYRNPIANDPRLSANAGCDTGTAVYLPSPSTTGALYKHRHYIDGRQLADWTTTAAQIAAQAVAVTSSAPGPVSIPGTPATTPNYLLIGAAALAVVLVAKAL